MLTLNLLFALMALLTGAFIFYWVYQLVTTPFDAELRGDSLMIDLLKKRVLIGKRKQVYVKGNERSIWLSNAKQCLQDYE